MKKLALAFVSGVLALPAFCQFGGTQTSPGQVLGVKLRAETGTFIVSTDESNPTFNEYRITHSISPDATEVHRTAKADELRFETESDNSASPMMRDQYMFQPFGKSGEFKGFLFQSLGPGGARVSLTEMPRLNGEKLQYQIEVKIGLTTGHFTMVDVQSCFASYSDIKMSTTSEALRDAAARSPEVKSAFAALSSELLGFLPQASSPSTMVMVLSKLFGRGLLSIATLRDAAGSAVCSSTNEPITCISGKYTATDGTKYCVVAIDCGGGVIGIRIDEGTVRDIGTCKLVDQGL